MEKNARSSSRKTGQPKSIIISTQAKKVRINNYLNKPCNDNNPGLVEGLVSEPASLYVC